MDELGELNPIQFQKAAVAEQQARVNTFQADNPNVSIPPVPKPEAALPTSAGINTIKPVAEVGKVAEGAVIGGLAVAGAIAETVVTATVGAMVQDAKEQAQIQKYRQELARIAESQKPPQPKTALGKSTEAKPLAPAAPKPITPAAKAA